jgi:hypothetical protein
MKKRESRSCVAHFELFKDSTIPRSSGVDGRADSRGIWIAAWYDSYVGFEAQLLTWKEINRLLRSVRPSKAMRKAMT